MCLKESNFVDNAPKSVTPDDSCSEFLEMRTEANIEWDDGKNKKNIKDHGLSFELAKEILKDPKKVQLTEVPEKWEKFDISTFDEKGIEKNTGNTDPVRGKILCKYQGEIYMVVYTHRGDLGDLALRVISLHRADERHQKIYDAFHRK